MVGRPFEKLGRDEVELGARLLRQNMSKSSAGAESLMNGIVGRNVGVQGSK